MGVRPRGYARFSISTIQKAGSSPEIEGTHRQSCTRSVWDSWGRKSPDFSLFIHLFLTVVEAFYFHHFFLKECRSYEAGFCLTGKVVQVEPGPSPLDPTHELFGQPDPTHWISPQILMSSQLIVGSYPI